MAADILLYKATHVPVGEDQTQHLELARELAQRFNRIANWDCLPVPQNFQFKDSLHVHPRVMSLQDVSKKMSKSDKSQKACISLLDDPETIRDKIKKAKTDSLGAITFDENRPELANLLKIYAAINGFPTYALTSIF